MSRLILTLLLFLISITSRSQSGNQISKIIENDMLTAIKMHGENFSLFTESSFKNELKILKVDTLDIRSTPNSFLALFSVRYKIPCEFYSQGIKEKCDTMSFIILKVDNDYFRVFGFYSSNILGIDYSKNRNLIRHVVDEFKRLGILNRRESGKYLRSLLKEQNFIPAKVHRPSMFLRIYYPNDLKKAATLLLRPGPLRKNNVVN